MKNKTAIQNKLFKQAVKKLKILGFTNITEKNISTDDVYKLYLKKILLLDLGRDKETDKAIRELLK